MKKLLTIVCLLIVSIVNARTFYVKFGGNNGNSGLSDAAAWADISKVNSFSFTANDTVAFKRGDTFYGGLVVNRSTITFTAYGTGAKPIFTGLSTVTGWVNVGGNLWEASVTGVSASVNLVLRNNVIQQVGRTPNAGLGGASYYYNTAATSTSVTGNALSSVINWTGAEIAVRCSRWDITRGTVLSHSGGTVTFATMDDPVPRVKYGYFFQRDRRCLDVDGEWFYSSATSKLVVYSIANPNTYNYQISTVSNNITSLFTNVSFNDIALTGGNSFGLNQNGGSGITVNGIDCYNQGQDGISITSATNVTINGCYLYDVLGNGIRLRNSPTYPTPEFNVNFTVTNNTLERIAVIAGMESTAPFNGSSAMVIRGGVNVTIRKNRVVQAGYIGIEYQGNNVLVENNYVERAGAVRGDVGAIYTVESANNNALYPRSNRVVKNNIMLSTVYLADGTPDYLVGVPEPSARGLYFDLGTRNVVADSNTVANIPVAANAWHGNNNDSLDITHNIFFQSGPYSFQRFVNAIPLSKLNITDNTIIPYTSSIRELSINVPPTTIDAAIMAMGLWDRNYWSVPLDLVGLRTVTTNADLSNYKEATYPFSKLQSIGKELNSVQVATNGFILINSADIDTTFRFIGYRKKDVKSINYDDSITVPRWYSVVLFDNGLSPGVNQPPTANAGADQLITLPTNTVSFTGTGNDPDGSITALKWTQLTGSATIISNPNSANTNVTFTISGTYTYQLEVTDNAGAKGYDVVQVTVNPAKQPAVVGVGADVVITLPINTVGLNAAIMNFANPVTFLWQKVSGTGGTITNSTAQSTAVTGLTAGTYRYRVTATDGVETSRDTMMITVNPSPVVNTPPIAVPGLSQVIYLPTNSTTLNGIGVDLDGVITAYLWTKEAGSPTGGDISSPTTGTTNISNLIEGVYTYKLTVTDNGTPALQGSNTLTITVIAVNVGVKLKIQTGN